MRLHQSQMKPGLCKKLSLSWDGPYLVVGVLADVLRRIQKTSRSKPKVVHVDRLKPCDGPSLDSWKYDPKDQSRGPLGVTTDNDEQEQRKEISMAPNQQPKVDNSTVTKDTLQWESYLDPSVGDAAVKTHKRGKEGRFLEA